MHSVSNQTFGNIKFKDESEKQRFFRYVVAPDVGQNDIDIFIKKYKKVENIKDVELDIQENPARNVIIKWHGIIDPLFAQSGLSPDKSLFTLVNEALNYIILHNEFVDMNKF